MSADRIAAANQLFAERLRRVRRARGLTGTELAALAGMPIQSIYRGEQGRNTPEARMFSVGEAVVLAAALGVPLDALVGDS